MLCSKGQPARGCSHKMGIGDYHRRLSHAIALSTSPVPSQALAPASALPPTYALGRARTMSYTALDKLRAHTHSAGPDHCGCAMRRRRLVRACFYTGSNAALLHPVPARGCSTDSLMRPPSPPPPPVCSIFKFKSHGPQRARIGGADRSPWTTRLWAVVCVASASPAPRPPPRPTPPPHTQLTRATVC